MEIDGQEISVLHKEQQEEDQENYTTCFEPTTPVVDEPPTVEEESGVVEETEVDKENEVDEGMEWSSLVEDIVKLCKLDDKKPTGELTTDQQKEWTDLFEDIFKLNHFDNQKPIEEPLETPTETGVPSLPDTSGPNETLADSSQPPPFHFRHWRQTSREIYGLAFAPIVSHSMRSAQPYSPSPTASHNMRSAEPYSAYSMCIAKAALHMFIERIKEDIPLMDTRRPMQDPSNPDLIYNEIHYSEEDGCYKVAIPTTIEDPKDIDLPPVFIFTAQTPSLPPRVVSRNYCRI